MVLVTISIAGRRAELKILDSIFKHKPIKDAKQEDAFPAPTVGLQSKKALRCNQLPVF